MEINPVFVYYTDTSIVLMVGECGLKSDNVQWMNDKVLGERADMPYPDLVDEEYVFPLAEADEARRKYVELTVKYNIQ